eukprot:NODE_752_length_1367_cov_220.338392_g567_i0.p1 GENE.NODE_752_length_1367_cov_220.338392_g567_i0~~NODE_752_length_1367_cov_220.338392_g567_i0.p1  ORF type:complete len:305 (+),score=59.64 NODE_752_length_1367_cov_220.338392_g567_i0:309-1223(+)
MPTRRGLEAYDPHSSSVGSTVNFVSAEELRESLETAAGGSGSGSGNGKATSKHPLSFSSASAVHLFRRLQTRLPYGTAYTTHHEPFSTQSRNIVCTTSQCPAQHNLNFLNPTTSFYTPSPLEQLHAADTIATTTTANTDLRRAAPQAPRVQGPADTWGLLPHHEDSDDDDMAAKKWGMRSNPHYTKAAPHSRPKSAPEPRRRMTRRTKLAIVATHGRAMKNSNNRAKLPAAAASTTTKAAVSNVPSPTSAAPRPPYATSSSTLPSHSTTGFGSNHGPAVDTPSCFTSMAVPVDAALLDEIFRDA